MLRSNAIRDVVYRRRGCPSHSDDRDAGKARYWNPVKSGQIVLGWHRGDYYVAENQFPVKIGILDGSSEKTDINCLVFERRQLCRCG